MMDALSFDDERWRELRGGYRVPIDLRPLLRRLETSVGSDLESAWHDVWRELYHQGDVGDGSFVAVPHLVRIHRARGVADWNTYALVATIDLARGGNGNPDVPEWTRVAYDHGLFDLAQMGVKELLDANDPELVRAILGVLAIVKGARTYGRILVTFTEDELLELEEQTFGNRNHMDTG